MWKKIFLVVAILSSCISSVGASFMYQETDPYCTISGTTHTSFPGEISDTSSWYIPTAYESACDETPELSQAEQERITNIMVNFFKENNFTGPVYGWIDDEAAYGWDDSLNPEWQIYVNKVFFPAVIKYINTERKKTNPNMMHVAILNQAVKTIGYDYFIGENL